MLKLDAGKKALIPLRDVLLSDAGYKEREDLQKFIYNSPAEFFAELGEAVFIVREELSPSDMVFDRIDLLGFDANGKAVIVELKRGSNKWQLGQALAYAGMISEWDFDRILAAINQPEKQEEFRRFLVVDEIEVNAIQRIILVAESYEPEVLIAAKWLCENFGVEIACCQIVLSQDGGSEYLSCTQVYPPKEIGEFVTRRGRVKAASAIEKQTLEAKLAACENDAVKNFFSTQLGLRMNSNNDALAYPQSGTIHWYVEPRSKRASVFQVGRFTQDQEFWSCRLDDPTSIKPQKRGALRFTLSTSRDFEAFQDAMNADSSQYIWERSLVDAANSSLDPEPQ